jgi:predicted transposase YbfD/YdcC
MKHSIPEYLPGEPPEGLQIDEKSLYRAFEHVSDGRKARGKQYPLPFLLTLLVLGKLAGETTISGVVDWTRNRAKQLRHQLGWSRGFPTNSTYTYALARANAEQIVQAVAQLILKAQAQERCGEEPSRLLAQGPAQPLSQVAMDGKTLRGTLGHEAASQPGVHLLSFYECQSGIVLAQRAVGTKENEISAAAALVHPALVKGRLISADAMHTQKKWCATVTAFGGDYLLIAKDNQPTLRQDLVDFFTDPDAERDEWVSAKQCSKGHGRLEVRQIWTSTQMNAWFEPQWAGVAQVFCVHRQVREGDKTREETVYGLTSLPRKRASAVQLLAHVQAHWHVENRLHWRRDVTLGEDRSQVRKSGAPQALAALNGVVLALMDWLRVGNVASKMRWFDAHPQHAIHLLCRPLQR